MRVTRTRSLIKTITFRVLATITTIIVVYFFTGRLDISLGAGIVDSIIKMIIYYFHERIWDKLSFGRLDSTGNQPTAISD